MITERAYYFSIARPKRFRHVIFFSLPQNSWIFEDIMDTFLDYFDYKNQKPQKIETKIENSQNNKKKMTFKKNYGKKNNKVQKNLKNRKNNNFLKNEIEELSDSDDEEDFHQKILLLFVKADFKELERVVGTQKALAFIDSNSSFKSLNVLD